MEGASEERRRFERYDTSAEIYFRVTYDVKTKIRYKLLDKEDETAYRKYLAIGRNVSVQGIAFTSFKQLNQGDKLHLEVYLPGSKEPVHMDGEVRWSKGLDPDQEMNNQFVTGVRILDVMGRNVDETVRLDEKTNVQWSIVLESILGQFRRLEVERHKKDSEGSAS